MQKQIADKKIIICICAVVAVIATAVIVLLLNREETFRSILVYEVEGTATIERDGLGNMNAAENLYLESGDRVTVAQDSGMRMKLDDDKYVMAEADTIFSVEAKGTDVNSKTRICLEQGAITNEIRHPLSEGSSYETSTPNSVMAVRGTIYRAEIYIDENGDKNTKLCCFQGKVGTTPIFPDGTLGEEILVPAGSELIIYSDGTTNDLRDIVYEELPAQAIENLISLLESGQTMEGITLAELDELIEQAVVSEEIEESKPEQAMQSDAEEDSAQEDEEQDADAADNSLVKTTKDVQNSGTAKAAAEQESQIPDETQPKVSEQVSNRNSGGDNAGGDSSQSGNGDDSSDNNNSDGHQPDNNRPNNGNPTIPPQIVTYTVTFEYQGTTFATQTVMSGGTVSAPTLVPAMSGEWDFDFGTGITADTTVKWKE